MLLVLAHWRRRVCGQNNNEGKKTPRIPMDNVRGKDSKRYKIESENWPHIGISAKNQLTEANDESMSNHSRLGQRSALQNIQNIKYRMDKI